MWLDWSTAKYNEEGVGWPDLGGGALKTVSMVIGWTLRRVASEAGGSAPSLRTGLPAPAVAFLAWKPAAKGLPRELCCGRPGRRLRGGHHIVAQMCVVV